MSTTFPDIKPHRSSKTIVVALSAGAFAFLIGAALMFGYFHLSAQNKAIAELVQQLEAVQGTGKSEIVTRTATAELLDLSTNSAPVRETAAEGPAAVTDVTVNTLQALVTKSLGTDLKVPEMLAPKRAIGAAELQSVALAMRGVEELINAAASGNYVVLPAQAQADGSFSKQRVTFPDQADNQARVEQLLAMAAAEGIISYSTAAKAQDGTIDGHIILIDLMAQAL